jgi:hypothetical protein
VAVAALLLWLCTAAVGGYLLVTAAHSGNAEDEPGESVPVPAERTAATTGQAAVTAPDPASAGARKLSRDDLLFAPASLQRARSEPLPGVRDYAEFAHPALAMIGIAFWLGYVVSRERLFAMIGLGILLGAICAGLSLFIVNTRAAKRAAAAEAESGAAAPGIRPLTAPPLVLTLHGIGAALTLLFALLIAFHA